MKEKLTYKSQALDHIFAILDVSATTVEFAVFKGRNFGIFLFLLPQ